MYLKQENSVKRGHQNKENMELETKAEKTKNIDVFIGASIIVVWLVGIGTIINFIWKGAKEIFQFLF